jgi:hypothetical protein
LPIDLDEPNHTCEVYNFRNGIQVPLFFANMLSLPHLLVRKKKGKRIVNKLQPIHTYSHLINSTIKSLGQGGNKLLGSKDRKRRNKRSLSKLLTHSLQVRKQLKV